ncbi:MAG: hypothetical protein IBJ13_07835 [Sphingopyxis sp.]|nr:hypothetical protein [Sphingopyxis sp.]
MMRAGLLIGLLVAAIPVQAQQLETPEQLATIAARFPHRDWYPSGYYEARLGAEGFVEQFPRQTSDMVYRDADRGGSVYDITDMEEDACKAHPDYYDDLDPQTQKWGDLALKVSRLRAEMERLGYPKAVYESALEDYERQQIDRRAGAAAGTAANGDLDADLVRRLNAARDALAPDRPAIAASVGRCAERGSASASPILRTSPRGAEIWMISAFAFNVCVRKKSDPWDRFACHWNEVPTETEFDDAGRFVYQIRWPDGTVKKGIRQFGGDQSGALAPVILFRKKGS